MNRFTLGQELSESSICDHECIYTATVLKRTAKTVTIAVRGKSKRCKIHNDQEGDEFIFPFGQYSMAAIFSA